LARKVILDVDTGIDDALALLLALRSPELDIIGITCVAGNVTLDRVIKNTCAVLDIAGAEIPVHAGARKPLLAPLKTATLFHGENGLGGVELAPSRARVEEEDAASFLVRSVREQPGEITLIAVGPLTNVALAVRRDSEFAAGLDHLIVMGGAVHDAGNVNGVAEANFSNDPEAEAAVVQTGRGPIGAWREQTRAALQPCGPGEYRAGRGPCGSRRGDPRRGRRLCRALGADGGTWANARAHAVAIRLPVQRRALGRISARERPRSRFELRDGGRG